MFHSITVEMFYGTAITLMNNSLFFAIELYVRLNYGPKWLHCETSVPMVHILYLMVINFKNQFPKLYIPVQYFWSKVDISYINCVRQQHSFSTHERVFLWKCQSFWDRKCLELRGTRTPNLRIHAECPNLLSCQGQTFAVPCFDTGSGGIDISEVKSTFDMSTVRGQQHSFSTHERVFLLKSKFLWKKISRPEGDSNPQPSDSCRML